MAKNITQYSLLISCPSDVEKEVDLINEAVDRFNEQYTSVLGISVITKYWQKDVYPASGDRPQSLINKQIVDDCDAAVAVFWTRFGSPTGHYGSGTEEEIHKMLDNQKPVFVYFSDVPIPPSKMVDAEYKRILEFRTKYQDSGIYSTYDSYDDFKQKFFAHISKHFISLKTVSEITNRKPSFKIVGLDNDMVTQTVSIRKFKPFVGDCIDYYNSSIRNLFYEILSISIPKIEKTEDYFGKMISFGRPVEIGNSDKGIIRKAAEHFKIEITDDFFDLGGLSYGLSVGVLGSSVDGTNEEKKKYDKLQTLIETINQMLMWVPIEKELTQYECIDLALCNDGTAIDRDIEITMKFPKSSIVQLYDLPEFDNAQKGYLLKEYDLSVVFGIPASKNNLSYDDSLNHPRIGVVVPSSIGGYIPDYSDSFDSALINAFCYSFYEDDTNDIVKLKMDYIKHNTIVAFPTPVFVRGKIEAIEYTITSQENPDILTGVVNVE